MKKIKIAAVASVAIVIVLAFIAQLQSINSSENYKVLIASIEALSQQEDLGCGGTSTFIKDETLRSSICASGATHLKCKEETNVCCDPSEQTDCPPIIDLK